ncbi:MAG: DNA polymerase III subunit alpha [Halobacteriovoraceae bacterium]|nr:DNA polymerase III subunit alpha [Halobacteriovoraceae bacterium]MCB9095621.1 DNA polymerase III subunit alpha [Halobacteriovoraceae bacterium]
MQNTPSFLETHPQSFVHLHLHTQYSLLDGAIRLKDLFKKAQEFGMPAVASTDHGNMFGAIDFYTQAKNAGIKPLVGSEIYFTPGSRFDRKSAKRGAKVLNSQDAEESKHQIHHLVLIAKNKTGYQNLCKLLSRAYLEGFYYKPRADYEILKEYSEGLVATTACLKGEVAYNFFNGADDRAHQAILKYRELFKDDFYLEIQENGLSEQQEVNEKLIKFASDLSIPLVATNDAHYLTREDAAAQEVLLCIQTGKTFNDEKRMKLTTNEFYFKSPEEMRRAFHYIPEACDNTLRIADKCNLELKWKDEKGKQIYHLPNFEIDTQETTEEYFARQAREGLEKRFAGPHFTKLRSQENWETELKPKYEARLEEEVAMISQTGFAGYFLIVSDFIKWAKNRDIPVGPGRGSGAGSVVAYSLEITNIDPITFNLLFERFINPERISMPDFDVDFCQDRRGEVIDYVTEKYGTERVGQIITFGKLQAKAVIRDVSRVFGLPYSEADMLAKLIPDELGITLDRALDMEPKLTELQDSDPKIKRIIEISKRLEGLLRHASIHAAGVIITNEPLVTYCPLYKGREGEQVVQFDKDFSEKIGLVKFDFLGLKTLTVIQNAVNFIRRDHDKTFDIESIDLEDKKVFEYISSGKTTGVFQLESSGMKDLCKRIAPDSLEDITAINALFRPGPLGSGMVDDFIERKHGRKEITYPFPILEDILKDTYGIIVYQEQVMNIARTIAGYTLGQADMLRRAMGKKKVEEMERHKEIFRAGAEKNGFDTKIAVELFDLMAMFAEYGFNKSHAVAYALIAYQTAYLKLYYPSAFYAALLGTEINNTDKVTAYINDAKEHGIEILPPDINESLWLFNVIDDKIRFGMGAVKNVGKNAVESIVKERKENGPYQGFVDFCTRINHSHINKRVIESLIKVGAFDECETHNRKTLLENMEMILTYAANKQKDALSGQASLFEEMGSGNQSLESEMLEIKQMDDFEDKEKLGYESQLIGIYVSGHPLDKVKSVIDDFTSMNIQKVKEIEGRDKREVVLAGMLTSERVFISKKGDKMAFATLEDLSGKIDCILFPRTYAEYEHYLDSEDPLILSGVVNLAEDPRKFFPSKIHKLSEKAETNVSTVRISINMDEGQDKKLQELKDILLSYRGTVPTELIFTSSKGKGKMELGKGFLVNPQPQLVAKVNELFKNNCVSFVTHGN